MNETEKRKHPRYPHPDKIEYICDHRSGEKVSKGITINISTSGLCLYLFDDLTEGHSITFKSTLPVSAKRASIRWIKKLQERFYIAGLIFT